jgi:hypothetical protein
LFFRSDLICTAFSGKIYILASICFACGSRNS